MLFIVLCTLGITPPGTLLLAQEEARTSIASESAATANKKSDQLSRYNLRAGPVQFSVNPSLSTEFNDNILFSEKNRESDVIIYPQLGLSAYWPITQMNSLSLRMGVGTARYVDHSDMSTESLYVTPDTELAWNFFVKDFRINLHERFTYQDTLYNGPSFDNIMQMGGSSYYGMNGLGGNNSGYGGSMYGVGGLYNLYGQSRYARYENTAGLSVDWDLNNIVWTVGYDHHNTIPNSPAAEGTELSSEQFYSRLTYIFNPQVKAGLETRVTINARDGNGFNDSWTLGGGPFVDTTLSSYLHFRVGGGYEEYFYTSSANNGNVYAYAELTHTVNQYLSHTLVLNRQNRLGLNANNFEFTSIGHTATWNVVRNVSLTSRLMATFADEFGGDRQFDESTCFYLAGLSAGYQLTQRWGTSASYNYLTSDSNMENRNASSHRVMLGVSYSY